jgi:hypothetical protein
MLDKALTICKAVVYHMGAAIDRSYYRKVDELKQQTKAAAGIVLHEAIDKAGPQFVYLTSREGDQPGDGGDPMHAKYACETTVHSHDMTEFIKQFRELFKEFDHCAIRVPYEDRLVKLFGEGRQLLTCPLQGHVRTTPEYFNPIDNTTNQNQPLLNHGTEPARQQLKPIQPLTLPPTSSSQQSDQTDPVIDV